MMAIKSARRALGNSRIGGWRLTSRLRIKMFRLAYPLAEYEAEYLGAKLVVPTDNISVAPGLLGGYYERLELEAFREVCRSSGTIIDVGGNIGLYSVVGGLAMPKGGRLYSFEPIAENISYLRRNVSLNELEQTVVPIDAAVGDQNGRMTIYLAENTAIHSAAPRDARHKENFRLVDQVSLDSYLAENGITDVDALKIDVEGFEGRVLAGAAKVIKDQMPTLFVEYIPFLLRSCGCDPHDFVSLVSGYRYCYVVNEPRNSLTRVSAEELAHLEKSVPNANLILIENPEHADAVRGRLELC
jgi:FkbM family methyltransferase